MADYTFASELFFDELLRISSDFVWKNSALALQNEDTDNIVNVEQYTLSVQGRLSFNIVEKFSEEVMMSLGMSEEEALNCVDDRENIPVGLRDAAVQKQMEWNIQNYDEQNNYYRMLNGLPDVDDTDYFYNTEYTDISDSDIPIHKLDSSQLYALEAKGYIDSLIAKYPEKKYLKHLTSRKIDIYTARNSDAFSILWITDSDYETLLQDFLDTYNECRNMIMNVFYQKVMSSSNTEYCGFVGMMILFQTIMQMHRKFLDTDITRDFYDEDSLRLVYDSYDVPFYQSIPMEYHKRIVKNINILLSHKGSTRVFYDLFDIFGFDGMAVFEFYMMKVHKFKDGKPVFYKNEDGSYNYREMYDILFGKVQLYNDPTTEMQVPRNQINYEDLIRNDPYWINDKDLLDKIYSEEFNYMESKYLGIQTTFNLMKIIYESSYYLKMILDNRDLLTTTSIYNSATHSNTNIFDIVIYICALITKKYGFEGNIPTDIHEIGSVMGFNFQEDLVTLKQNISENDYLKNDSELLNLLETMNVSSLASIKKVYKNLTSLKSYLVNKMHETDDVETYWAYYELYETIMYSEYTESTFKKSDGETASSFADMLADINRDLYTRYTTQGETDIDNEISDNLYLLKSSCTALTHLQYADSINIDTIIEYLFKLLDFFKSAKADLTGYEIVYSLISSAENIMKMMNLIVKIFDDYSSDPQYSIIDELTDLIALYKERLSLLDKYKLIDEMHYEWNSTILYDIITYLEDDLRKITEIIYELTSTQEFIEDISTVEIFLPDGDNFEFKDTIIPLYEEIKEILKFLVIDEHPIIDEIVKITEIFGKNHTMEEQIRFAANLALIEYSKHKSEFSLTDSITDNGSIYIYEDTLDFANVLIKAFESKMKINTTLSMSDMTEVLSEIMKVGYSEYKFKDSMTEQFITLLYTDVYESALYYEDAFIKEIFTHYLEDEALFYEELKSREMFQKQSGEYSQYGFLVEGRSTHKITDSSNGFTDSLLLLKQEIYED